MPGDTEPRAIAAAPSDPALVTSWGPWDLEEADAHRPACGTRLRVVSASAVAAAIPYQLGFFPAESLVLSFFEGAGRLVSVARFDLAQVSNGTLGGAPAGGRGPRRVWDASAVHVAAFSRGVAAAAEVVGSVSREWELLDLTLVGAGVVADSTWWGVGRDGTVSGNGESLLAGEALATTCRLAMAGRSFLADRGDLVAIVRRPEWRMRVQVGRSLARLRLSEGGSRRGPRLDRGARVHIEESVLGFLVHGSVAPRAAEVASWALAFADSRVREPVLWRLSPAAPTHVSANAADAVASRFAWLVRCVPRHSAAALAAALAAFAWQSGNGALAGIAAGYSVEADPANRLGRLVSAAVARGTPPGVWIDLMRSMSLEDLRGAGA